MAELRLIGDLIDASGFTFDGLQRVRWLLKQDDMVKPALAVGPNMVYLRAHLLDLVCRALAASPETPDETVALGYYAETGDLLYVQAPDDLSGLDTL